MLIVGYKIFRKKKNAPLNNLIGGEAVMSNKIARTQ